MTRGPLDAPPRWENVFLRFSNHLVLLNEEESDKYLCNAVVRRDFCIFQKYIEKYMRVSVTILAHTSKRPATGHLEVRPCGGGPPHLYGQRRLRKRFVVHYMSTYTYI